jgi:AcrR family transcriptional regulator
MGHDTTDPSRLRNAPVQQRAAERVDEILDAAASVVHDVGPQLLTTTLVAERAGAGVGTLYRYFPDRTAILKGLSDRNVAHLRTLFAETVAMPKVDVEDELDALFHAYVANYREAPAFQDVRTGEWLTGAERRRGAVIAELVDVVLATIGPRHGIPEAEPVREALIECFHVSDALVLAAFLDDSEGDERSLRLAWEVSRATVHRLLLPAVQGAVEGTA